MSDYTLSVEVTGDAGKMKEAFEQAEDAAKKLKEGFKDSSNEASANLANLSAKIGESSEKIKAFGSKMSEIGNRVRNTGLWMTAGLTAPIMAAGKSMFQAASDYQENLNKIDVAFKDNAQEVKDWANTATEQFGLSKNSALEAASLFGDMGTSMGLSTGEASKMSTSLTGLAGDLASFKNMGIDEAMTALNGVFTGETESLKRLGVVMTETNLEQFALAQGFSKSYKEMSQAEKVQLRYAYVMEMTKNAHGDYARTADGAANSTKTFWEKLENLKIVLGEHLLPIFTPIIQKATEMVDKFANLDGGVQQKILMIVGALALIGPALVIFGQMAAGLGSIITLVGHVGTGFSSMLAWFSGAIAQGGILNGIFMAMGGTIGGLVIFIGAIIGAIALISFTIMDLWNTSETFRTAVFEIWNSISSIIQSVWTNFLQPTFQAVIDGIMRIVTDSILPLYENFKSNFENIAVALSQFLTKLSPFVDTVTNFLGVVIPPVVTFLAEIFGTSFKIISNVIGVAFDTISGVVSGILQIFGGLITFLTGVFTGNWSQAWQGVVDIFSGVFNSIVSIGKGVMNAIIGVINGAISGLNRIKIPDWVPGVGVWV